MSTKLAIVVTVVWLALVAVLTVHHWHRPTLAETPLPMNQLNSWGDFFAGVFAPLAFLWFLAAFSKQSQQLKLQREELGLQREEMKLTRVEFARFADHQERQTIIAEAEQSPDVGVLAASVVSDDDDGLTMKLLVVGCKYYP